MSRRSIFIHSIIALIFSLLLTSCGSGSAPLNSTLGQVPGSWSKYLSAGSIGATLDVYGSDGTAKLHQDLVVDMTQGTISAPQFKLPIGDTYRFVIIFSYGLGGGEAIPYAFADFTWLVDEFSEAVSFSENDIRYQYDAQDSSLSADLSEGKIPNLDLDGDGWSNWEELRDKVSPKDSNSIPIVPTVEVRGQQDGNSSSATVVVTARDNAHVEGLRLVDPLCGVTVISDTLVNNVDGSVTRTLTLRLDLLSVSKNPRTLQGLADDGVTPAQNVNQTLNFTLSGNASQPYFVFTEPEEGAEIEGPTVFRGLACSRADIDISSAKFLNQETSSATWTGQKNTQTGDYELESSSVDTTVVPDGLNTFKVEVADISNKIGQGARTYRVVNDNEIKIVSPVGRRWVYGNEQIAAIVKNLPDSNLVVIEGDSSFSLTSSTSGGAVGRLGVGNLPEGTVVPLTFKAVRSNGSEVVRKVEFTVRNKPQITQFQAEASQPFRNWSTNLNYRVVNVDPGQLSIAGQSTANIGTRQCLEDSVAKGVIVCTGQVPVKVTGNQNYKLSANRSATYGEICTNCNADQDYSISAPVTLSNDIPEINAAIPGDDEPESPERIAFPANNPGKAYLLSIVDIKNNTEILSVEANGGDVLTLNALEARRDYRATLQILNGPGGNVEQTMFKDFTTGDLGLVGWWRFKDDPNLIDCPGETASKTVCDYSGKGNHGIPSDTLDWSNELLGGSVALNGVSDSILIPHANSLNIGSVLTVSCNIHPAESSTILLGVLVKDNPAPGPFVIEQYPNNVISFSVYLFNGSVGSWNSTYSDYSSYLPSNFWVTGIYDGTKISINVDDQLLDSVVTSGIVQNQGQALHLGFSPFQNGYFFGELGGCLIFNRAISQPEVDSIVKSD